VLWSYRGITRILYVENGIIIYASDQGDRDGVQRAILQKPDIPARELRAATARGLEGDDLLRHLADREFLTPQDVTGIIIARALRLITDGLYIADGEIEFIDGKLPVEPLCSVSLEIPFALMMAVHEVDERRRRGSDAEPPIEDLELELITTIIDDGDLAVTGPERNTAPAAPPVAALIHYFKGAKRHTFQIGPGERLIGRGENTDIRLVQDRAVSRIHAKIACRHGRFFIEDMDSANGVTINGVRIQRYELIDGDEITIGSHLLVFERENTQG